MIQTFYEIKKETYALLTVICGIDLIVVLVVCLDLAPGSSIVTLIRNKRKHTNKKKKKGNYSSNKYSSLLRISVDQTITLFIKRMKLHGTLSKKYVWQNITLYTRCNTSLSLIRDFLQMSQQEWDLDTIFFLYFCLKLFIISLNIFYRTIT